MPFRNLEELWNSANSKQVKWRKPRQMSVQSKLKPASVPVAHISETNIPLTAVTGDLSHAIVNTSTSATRHPASAKSAVDMLRRETNAEKPMSGSLAITLPKSLMWLRYRLTLLPLQP